MSSEAKTNYPVVTMEGVEPLFVRQMLIGAMTLRYLRAAQLDAADAHDAAMATWDTDWESDPAPRDFENAVEAVDGDLEYWGD